MMLSTPAPAPTKLTIREQIMRHLVARFEQPPQTADGIKWGHVTRKKIAKADIAYEDFAAGLYDTSERVREGTGFEYRSVNVVIEFHARLAMGDEPGTFMNHCLGQVIALVGQDITMGGLALNSAEQGSELDIDGAFDEYVSGVAIFSVSYRCRPNDPYTRV